MSAQGRLQGKVAVVTGSGQGIGAAIARLFAREGAAVVVNSLHEASSQATARAITDAGGRAVACVGDVRSSDDARRIMDTAVQAFGGLDILVNNAGFPLDEMIHRMSDEQWDDCVDVTLKGTFNCIRAAAPHMRKEGHNGRVINVSAMAGLMGGMGMANYCAAKHGVHGLTRTVALEWARYGVTCNAIAYGWVHTRLTGEREAGAEVLGHAVGIPRRVRDRIIEQHRANQQTPEQAANAALLLALPEAQYITATILNASMGQMT
ncbi:3-oxoacyl-[acyl-carrier protein] reductase [Gammaproteobacteria bacterium]|nr:3-oxoacyl-[acyl-carrier protein] reductase [Gammaproteobacteria bacterium]